MAGAFDEFLVHSLGSLRQHQIRENIKAFMQADDISFLSKHVPCLAKYADGPLEATSGFEVNKDQIHQLFIKLIRALSASGQALCFFMDDLQWADSASIDLFAALTKAGESNLSTANDSANRKKAKVLFIGSCRDNEMNDNLHLVQMLDELEKSTAAQLTHISVQGFDSDALNGIVSESLCLPLRRTKPLTEIILQKTDGIVIHIIEFISRLTHEKILCHSFVKGWEWDSEVIEGCPISDSVAQLFTFKLETLDKNSLIGVQICSIFGIRIEQRIIDFLEGYDGDNSVDITAGVKAALEVGLVETRQGASNVYNFAHDIIAQVSNIFATFHFGCVCMCSA